MGDVNLDAETDLFGLPVPREKGRGRPPHVWTVENSNKVNLLFACGHTPLEIAQVLGITKPTFYKHYFNEIGRSKYAPLMMKARQLERLNAQAENGNVAAEKALAGMIQAERVATTAQRVKSRASDESKTPALGKKETANQAARNMTGVFGTRQPPAGLIQ